MAAKMTVVTTLLNGRRVGRFASRKTLTNDETVQEAIDGGFVVGKKESIGQNAKGVLRGMVVGIQKDGNGRKINEFISLQPVVKGSVKDPTDTIVKEILRVRVAARTLKELQPDISDWSFALEGATSDALNITSVSTGEELNAVTLGKAIDLNGFGLAMGAGDTLSWSVPEMAKAGTVAAAKITSSWTRITVLGDALDEIKSAAYDGKTIALTASIGGQTATKTATLKYEA